jgi:hypothetical protein
MTATTTRTAMRRSLGSIATIIALATGTLVSGASTPAGAADKGTFTLTNVSQTASWSGEFEVAGPGVPEQCVSTDVCDFVGLDVDLPDDVWRAEPGGMLVAVRLRTEIAHLINLYLYGPHDERIEPVDLVTEQPIDRSENFYSAGAQSVWVEKPPNGRYTVVVAPSVVIPPHDDYPPAVYDGLVSFERGLTIKRHELNNGQRYTQTFVAFGRSSPTPADELLPDLVPFVSNFHIEKGTCTTPSFYVCNPQITHQPSCYPEEIAGLSSIPPDPKPDLTRCLRFDHGEYNYGEGPLEMHLYPGKGTQVSEQDILTDLYQRIYSSDGSVTHRVAGPALFHHAHGHYHGLDWRTVTLHERLPDGSPGQQVASMPNKGVCTLDVRNGRFGQRRGSPLAYGNADAAPCMSPTHEDPNHPDPDLREETFIRSGISVGWADYYPWSLIDQYVDISKVADGKYVLVATVDAKDRIREMNEANNTTTACVEISGITVRVCPNQPDLQVTSLSASNTKAREGEKVRITATVSNTGDGDAPASSTEFLLDGSRMPGGLLDTPALAAGESVTLSLNWDTRGVTGEYRIQATADSPRTIVESSDDNNDREITVVVRGNKIRNPSFEQSSNGSSPDAWSSSGSTGYESGGSDGARSVSTQPGGSWTSAAVPIEAGRSYDASVVAAGAGGTLVVQQLSADGSVLSSVAQPYLPAGRFTPTSLQLTALAAASQARIVLLGGLSGKTTFDDVGLFGS